MTGLVIADRVKETTATTGTGTLTLAGAATQFQSFGAVGNGNQCNYCILGGNGTDWETGIGTYTLSGTTLSRDVVLASSNSGSKISLTGTSTVFLTEPGAALMASRGAPIVPPKAYANWTPQNSGSGGNVANGVQISDTAASTTEAVRLRGLTLASPSTPYTVDMNISASVPCASAVGNFGVISAGWTDGTKYQTILSYISGFSTTSGGIPIINVTNFNNATTATSGSGSSGFCNLNFADVWFRFADDGTNITLAFSVDGVSYTTLYNAAKSGAFLGASGYTNLGFFTSAQQSGQTTMPHLSTLRSWYQH
jgi:hypothetical protein